MEAVGGSGVTDGYRPGRKAPKQMFASGPGEDEASSAYHPVLHCA